MNQYDSPAAFSRALADVSHADWSVKRRFCEDDLPRYVECLAPEIPPHDPDVRQLSVITLGADPQASAPVDTPIISGNRLHWEQLKLFAAELEFISIVLRTHGYDIFAQSNPDRVDGIVYAGPIDVRHLVSLIDHVPPTTWYICGPERAYRGDDRSHIVHICDEADTTALFADKRVLFIGGAQDAHLVRLIRPVASMLRLSTPPAECFDGLLMTHAYGCENAAECSLIFSDVPPMITYDVRAIEATLCRFNRVEREYCFQDENNFMLFPIMLKCADDDHVQCDVSVNNNLIVQPPFIGHDAWRLNEILLHFVLTMYSRNKWLSAEVVPDGCIGRDNWNVFHRELIEELIEGDAQEWIEKRMNDIISAFLATTTTYEDHIIKIRRIGGT